MIEFIKNMAGRKGWLWLPGLWALWLIGKVLVWPLRLLGNRVAKDGNVVFLTCFSKWVLFWPLIPVGFVVSHGLDAGNMSTLVVGWLFVLALLVYAVTLTDDVDLLGGIVLLLIVALFVLGSDFLDSRYGIEVLGPLYRAIKAKEPTVSPGVWSLVGWAALVVSCIYTIPKAVLAGRIQASGRSVEEFKFGRRAGNYPTVGKSVSIQVEDIFEFLLTFGGGYLVISDASTGRVEKKYGLIFGAWFFNEAVTRMYLTTGVHRDDLNKHDPVETEQPAKSDPLG